MLLLEDGAILEAGSIIMMIRAEARSILGAERPALNFIQRLCDITSMTHVYTKAIAHTKCHLLDTRKTTPGYRILEKQAVVHAGGKNHRLCLYDRAMVKDNHLMTGGKIKHLQASIDRLQSDCPHVELDSKLISIFPSEKSLLSLASSLLIEISEP